MYRIIPVHHFHSTWHIHLICTCMSISCSQMTRVMKLLTTLYHTHATQGMHTSQPDKTSSLIHYSSHIHYTWNGLSGLSSRAGLTHKQTKHLLRAPSFRGARSCQKKKTKLELVPSNWNSWYPQIGAQTGAGAYVLELVPPIIAMLEPVSQNWKWCPKIRTCVPKLELVPSNWSWCPKGAPKLGSSSFNYPIF